MTTPEWSRADGRASNQEDVEEETKHGSPRSVGYKHSGSFRILSNVGLASTSASFEGASPGASTADDPMAWADLEAFGGTRKTLEEPQEPPSADLSRADVRAQLDELHEMERHMRAATTDQQSKRGMLETIAWLKKHQREHRAELEQHRRHRSSSFVRAVLGLFHPRGQRSNHNQHGEEEELVPALRPLWGQAALGCAWSELGFALLNVPIVEDMARVRHVVESKELQSASSQAVIALAKWLQRFDRHVTHAITFKEYLLDERAVLVDRGCKLTTDYDQYKESLATALQMIHGDRQDLSDAMLRMLEDLTAVLRDEVAAVQEVVLQVMTEDDEYAAISNLFHHLSDDETGGILVAMLLGWMKTHMETDEVDAFLALFDDDMQDKIAGEWMRHYATYLELLEEFSVHSESSMAFFT